MINLITNIFKNNVYTVRDDKALSLIVNQIFIIVNKKNL